MGRPRLSRYVLLALCVIAGGGLALQARLNGELGVRLASPLAAGSVNFLVGLAAVSAVVVTRRAPIRQLRDRPVTRWWQWTGGACAVLYVYAVVKATPLLGVALASVAIASGMATAGLVVDALGLGTSGRHRVSGVRLTGAALAVMAVVVSRWGMSGDGHVGELVLAFAGGLAVGSQQAINSRLGAALGHPDLAAFVSFLVGSVLIVLLTAAAPPSGDWPASPSLYAGGLLAAAYVLLATRAVARLGALTLALATIGGQLLTAAVLDVVAPLGDERLTAGKVVGVLLAIGGVGVSVLPATTRSSSPRRGLGEVVRATGGR